MVIKQVCFILSWLLCVTFLLYVYITLIYFQKRAMVMQQLACSRTDHMVTDSFHMEVEFKILTCASNNIHTKLSARKRS